MSNTASKVLSVAEAEVGYLEKKSNSNLYDKTANAGSGNYTKYAYEFDTKYTGLYNGKKNGYAWCDVFVDWLFVQAFGVATAKDLLCQPSKSLGAGCKYSANYYKEKNQFHKNNPKVGDQIFFWDSGKTKVAHTGIVYKVDSTKVYTIEGNTSGASGVVANGGGVCKKSYSLSYGRIYGYGRPKYDAEPVVETKTVTQLAREVLKGKWGNGATRKQRLTEAGYDYTAVQKEVNRLCNSSKKSNETVAKEVIDGKWGNGTERKNRLTAAGYDYTAIQKIVNKMLK